LRLYWAILNTSNQTYFRKGKVTMRDQIFNKLSEQDQDYIEGLTHTQQAWVLIYLFQILRCKPVHYDQIKDLKIDMAVFLRILQSFGSPVQYWIDCYAYNFQEVEK